MAKRIIIIGGGFGGLYAAKALGGKPDVEVTLIDRRNFHLFQPLLYQVATGELSPADVAFPLRAILSEYRNIRVIMGEAVDIEASQKRLIMDDGTVEPYDALIVATGAQNHYFGNDEWKKHAPGLKSLEEATAIRHRILYAFEAAERVTDPVEHRAWLTFVIVGAGPTGVELAGALGEIANDTLKGDFHKVKTEEARILLLDNAPRVLMPFTPDLSAEAERCLISLGVRTRTQVKVISVDDSGVSIETRAGREHIHAHTVLWAAGVAGSSFGKLLADRVGFELARGGRVAVDEFCNIPGHPEIFVIGDLAVQLGEDDKPLPGVAPVAMQQGRYVGRRILGKETERFRYWDKGSLAVIGRGSAVALIGRAHLHGLIAWLTWLFIHLMYLVGFQNRLIVFIRWAFNYFTYNRGARLITGEPVKFHVSPHEPEHMEQSR